MPQMWRLPDRGRGHRRAVGDVLRHLLAHLDVTGWASVGTQQNLEMMNGE